MEFIDRLTGAKTEKDLAQYSEVYGEILLGMHRDMERHRTLIKEHDQNMRQGVARVIGVEAELRRRFDELSRAVTQAEAHSKNASRFSEQAKSAALAAGASAKESKEELDKTKEFLNEVQRKWQALLSMVESQREEVRTMDSTIKRLAERQRDEIRVLELIFQRFRARVMWSSAAIALVVIIGGLVWMIHFFR
jgi:chromosome segregation ATPase